MALYNTDDAKTHRFDCILKPLVEDVKELESQGMNINTDIFVGTVCFGIAQITGDNLGLNGICGFVEWFVSNHFCRNCRMHIMEMPRALKAKLDLLRKFEDYNHDLEQNYPTSIGVKAPCLFNDLHYFHVTTNYTPIMHDVLEGICGLEVHLVIADLVRTGFFSLDMLNSRITSFDYGDSVPEGNDHLELLLMLWNVWTFSVQRLLLKKPTF